MPFGAWLRETLRLTPRHRLERLQRASPPRIMAGIPGDLGTRRYSFLEPRLPSGIRALFESGRAVIGEVGRPPPAAQAGQVWGGYVVQVFIGLSDFFYEVARAMNARSRLFEGDVAPDPQARLEEVVAAIEAIFRAYRAERKVAKPDSYLLSPEQKQLASSLAANAEAFVIAHELGHLQLWETDPRAPSTSVPAFELEADAIALRIVTGMCGGAGSFSQREAYAGAEFAVRVFAGLEHLGMRFDQRTHPLPTHRLENIRRLAREYCGTRRKFLYLSTIAMAYDQLLEEAERRLAGPGEAGFVVGSSAERLLSTISVLIEEFVKGSVSDGFVLVELAREFSFAPLAVVRQAAADAAHMYLVEDQGDSDPEAVAYARREAEAFTGFAARLEEPWRAILAEAIRHPSG